MELLKNRKAFFSNENRDGSFSDIFSFPVKYIFVVFVIDENVFWIIIICYKLTIFILNHLKL